VVSKNLSEFILDIFRVQRLATDTTEGGSSLIQLALLDPVTRGLWEESETDGQNYSPQELDCDRNSIGASVASVLSGIYNAVGEQDTNGDAELITYKSQNVSHAGRVDSTYQRLQHRGPS